MYFKHYLPEILHLSLEYSQFCLLLIRQSFYPKKSVLPRPLHSGPQLAA